MLIRLEIKDFALINHTVFDLREGLTILTGETGAGKSIIIDSIGCITGSRANKDMIRHGSDCAVITAVFDVSDTRMTKTLFDEYGIEIEDDTLFIVREIFQNGKTFARINGKMVPIQALKSITKNLLDIHGQHENQAIFRQDMQLELLDRFAGEGVLNAINIYRNILGPYYECIRSLQEFIFDDSQKEQMIDILEFQIKEIKTIHPKLNEDTELSERRKIIANIEKIRSTLEQSLFFLNGDISLPALPAVSSAKNLMEHQLGNFEEFKGIRDTLSDVEAQLDEVCEAIRYEMEKVLVEPGELEKIDSRLDLLFRLKKKYGGSIEGVLEFYKNAVQKLTAIRSSEERVHELLNEKDNLYNQLKNAAKIIYEQRKAAAILLENDICVELGELGMKGTKFSVSVNHNDEPNQVGFSGFDQIEFLISPNVGEDLKPLSRIASGGEASRIMLAIKTILAKSDEIPLLIFDEVDTGISGKTAGLLGDKLSEISKNHQVLCVTHMAQIAAKALQHIYIEKIVENDETTTRLKYLDEESRVKEIARLLSGGQNEAKAIDLAREMLSNKD